LRAPKETADAPISKQNAATVAVVSSFISFCLKRENAFGCRSRRTVSFSVLLMKRTELFCDSLVIGGWCVARNGARRSDETYQVQATRGNFLFCKGVARNSNGARSPRIGNARRPGHRASPFCLATCLVLCLDPSWVLAKQLLTTARRDRGSSETPCRLATPGCLEGASAALFVGHQHDKKGDSQVCCRRESKSQNIPR
jgi:hypothetical protein